MLDVLGTASIGGQLTFRSTFGTIQTTADQTLAIGGNTTGKIVLSAFNGQTVTLNNTGAIVFGGYVGSGAGCTLKTDGSGNVVCGVDQTGVGIASPFAEVTGVNGGFVEQTNITEDLLIGGTSTNSADFAFSGKSNSSFI